ncbi:MAG: hypothetical protein Q9218_002713 [Villophora microphyllina]
MAEEGGEERQIIESQPYRHTQWKSPNTMIPAVLHSFRIRSGVEDSIGQQASTRGRRLAGTVSSSNSPSPQARHAAAPPSSPVGSPNINPQSDPIDGSSSSIPSRRPSTAHAPDRQGFCSCNHGHPHKTNGEVFEGDYSQRIHRLNERLKQRKVELLRFQSNLNRKAEELRFRETLLDEMEARVSGQARAHGSWFM